MNLKCERQEAVIARKKYGPVPSVLHMRAVLNQPKTKNFKVADPQAENINEIHQSVETSRRGFG